MSSIIIKGALSAGVGFALMPVNIRVTTHICTKLFGRAEFSRLLADHPFNKMSRILKIGLTPFVLVIAPVQEEIVFRLFLHTVLKDLLKNGDEPIDQATATIKAIALSSVCFGLYHFVNCLYFLKSPKSILPQVIATTIAGVAFGIFYEIGGLPSSIGMHMGYNCKAWLS